MANEPTLIIEIQLPVKLSFRFQMLLEGEDGLAVTRCFDPEHKKQQLWTTPSQRDELLEWISSLPEVLEVRVLREWIREDSKIQGPI